MTDRVEPRPRDDGIWIVVFGELTLFAAFFITMSIYRNEQRALFKASQATLDRSVALIDTILLLSSSWLLVVAVAATANRRLQHARYALTGSILCGVGFVLLKSFEYSEHVSRGIGLTSNDFFMFYFMLTGIHLVHVIVGLSILGYLLLRTKDGCDCQALHSAMVTGATFWHLVDILWIALFSLIYLVS